MRLFGMGKKDSVQVQDLRKTVSQLQHTLDILIAQVDTSKKYTGNPYKNPDTAITELSNKYENRADWGCVQTKNIVDIRSVFTIGEGVVLREKNEDVQKKSREMEFMERLFQLNDLNEETPQSFAKEAEIEGRFLCRLIPDFEKETVQVRWVSYSTNKYTIVSDPNDYKKYLQAKWKSSDQKDIVLEEGEFIYKRFSGRTNKVNDVAPKLANVLRQLEDLDKCLYDWRGINHLFSAPTPHFKVQTAQEVDDLNKKLKAANWKLGKYLVTTSELNIVTAGIEGVNSLKEEMTNLAKIISGAVGVPVHFLGLPDLLSNRSTSNDLFELIQASTSSERMVWTGFYEELCQKSLEIANKFFSKAFDLEAVKAAIPFISSAKLKELTEIWLPLWQADAIDLQYLLRQVPNSTPEMRRKLEEKESQTLKMLTAIERTSGPRLEEDGNGEGGRGAA